ncbi:MULTISPECIES: ABC transporter substrate-binding protein [unclassified Sulfitobacter]|jgi:ABC-type transport system substrate-binding protein|uniref:ABC transporter substrate-binding protein n=1 Tax=unclassified Sulfitobacter TaxID=196795 RepID=UPI0007C363B5|nr:MULTISPECIES: ABC transporter substrate-binding protein [unclassified Sulfitobacter]KZX94761.1 peptide ABC transporter substrate-binding protein [Sulfitobacter sp. HI0021]KZX95565.1 peptide ABC transporter substrate-binding protein [Sulfitobacter sp. HI0027]KZZ00210.1 peptide ABC transporter substrate-binding protein [Sulfitobacter sp. HI0076]
MSGRNSLLDRRALFTTGAAAALLAATGASAGEPPRRGGRLRLALSGATREDTWAKGDGLFMQVARQGLIFDTLTEVTGNGILKGELATGWQASDGARQWQFDLRPDVRFHDGSPLTARDVVASLQSVLTEAEVAVQDDLKVQVTLAAANPDLPLLLAQSRYVIRPAHAPEAGIGTGLYSLRRFSAGRQVLAERVESHYKDGTAGWFDTVELVSIPARDVRAQALSEGLVDAADLPARPRYRERGDVTLQADSAGGVSVLSDDLRQPPNPGRQAPMDNLRAPERWWFG